jgi:hypothetical protein
MDKDAAIEPILPINIGTYGGIRLVSEEILARKITKRRNESVV